MVITEKEAKLKWCQEAVASHTDPRSGFHSNQKPSDSDFTCLGSVCMAWRWHDPNCYTDSQGKVLEELGESRRGYCGKGGRL